MSDFTGLLSAEFNQFHINMISEAIRNCAVTCTAYFGVSKWTDCPNCIFDNGTGKSSGVYQAGGSIPFTTGICPFCRGEGRLYTEVTETLSLMPVYDHRQWIRLKSNVQTPENYVQTLSLWTTTYDSLVQAEQIAINTALTDSVDFRYERSGKPMPCGLGHNSFVVAMWKRIKNG